VEPTESSRHWQLVREILDGALAVPPSEWPDYVRAEAQGRTEIIAEVESLLAGANGTATWIDGSPLDLLSDLNPDLPAGRLIAHYEIVKKLGAGGMGVVYLAKDTKLGRLAALKLLASPLESAEERRRFAKEARAASALNHPNIITIYEYATIAGLDFIAMEYVRGTTLAERLKQDRPPLAELLEIARQTAVALCSAHAAGIVHRDLKPANIMITAEGAVKVLDFGIAKLATSTGDSSTERLSIIGTPAYMAPEVALGQQADARADIFALGVILYEMAAGRRPFRGKNMAETLQQLIQAEPAPVETLNPAAAGELGTLITKCLRKDKAQRWESMAEVAAGLERVLHPPVVVRSSRRWLLAGASAAVAGTATFGVSRWLSGSTEPALSYTLEAQKETGQLPFAATTKDTFEGGWKFRVRMHAARPGHFYLVTESPTEISVVFPLTNQVEPPVSSSVSGWYVFDQNPGLERVWVIWSGEPVSFLVNAGRADAAGDTRIRAVLTRLPTGVPGMAGELLQLRHK